MLFPQIQRESISSLKVYVLLIIQRITGRGSIFFCNYLSQGSRHFMYRITFVFLIIMFRVLTCESDERYIAHHSYRHAILTNVNFHYFHFSVIKNLDDDKMNTMIFLRFLLLILFAYLYIEGKYTWLALNCR